MASKSILDNKYFNQLSVNRLSVQNLKTNSIISSNSTLSKLIFFLLTSNGNNNLQIKYINNSYSNNLFNYNIIIPINSLSNIVVQRFDSTYEIIPLNSFIQIFINNNIPLSATIATIINNQKYILPSIIINKNFIDNNLILDLQYDSNAPFYKEFSPQGDFNSQVHYHTLKTENELFYNLTQNNYSNQFFINIYQSFSDDALLAWLAGTEGQIFFGDRFPDVV